MEEIFTGYFNSPVGIVKVLATNAGIRTVIFIKEDEKEEAKENKLVFECINQLKEYFEGKRKEFSLPFESYGTIFQQLVWEELYRTPFGTTTSYGVIADRIGKPKAVRAVGSANGKNQIAIIIPCHRIIGKNGKLVGYNGELWRKQWLLEHEKKFIN
jgi:methylated-DNA-[protein]-cysteine S-methyltransferase